MSDQLPLFGQMNSMWQLSLFVAGIAVGASSVWLLGKPAPVVPIQASVQPEAKAKPAEPEEKEEELEEDEEDEEWDSDDDIPEEDLNDPENVPHKMVFIVRTDLKMGHGKIAAQCGHATLAAYKTALKTHPRALRFWQYYGQAKIALKVPSEAEMDAIYEAAKAAGIVAAVIADAGKTQIAAGSRTVLALGPAPVAKIDEIVRHLKLY